MSISFVFLLEGDWNLSKNEQLDVLNEELSILLGSWASLSRRANRIETINSGKEIHCVVLVIDKLVPHDR